MTPTLSSALTIFAGDTARCNVPRVPYVPHALQVTLLAAGSSAAIAASFHAPFAGVIFAHEVGLGLGSKIRQNLLNQQPQAVLKLISDK